jgi:hypothetical protein
MSDSYKGYNLHNDVEDPALRAWNRCQTAINIRNDQGLGMAEVYIGKVDSVGQLQMKTVFQAIALKGEDYVRRSVFKGAI